MEKLLLILGAISFVILASLVFSIPVWLLWNGCLVGAITGVNEVSWLQAWGLALLCGLLFKSNTVQK